VPINYDLLDEGDTLNAASLNSRVASLQTGVNDLTKDDLAEQALRSEHLSSLVKSDNMILHGAVTGMMKASPTPDLTTNTYGNTIASSAGPVRTVVRAGPGGSIQGYSVISARLAGVAPPLPFPGNVLDCDISFSPSVNVVSATSPAAGFSDTTYCTGLLVRLNVSLINFPYTGQGHFNAQGVVVGIAWEADGALGTYNFLEQSETGIGATDASSQADMINFSDISTSALITSADTGGALVARVSGVIATIDGYNVTIREWNMSIIPIFGGTL
jgi:hypothetical protein